MAKLVMGQQQPMMMPSSISSSPLGRKPHIISVSDNEHLLDGDNRRSDIDKDVDQHEDTCTEWDDSAPMHNISVITVDNGSSGAPPSELYSQSCGVFPKLDVNSNKHNFGVGRGDKGTHRPFASVSAMCSQVVPPLDVGAGACGAIIPLGRSPLHEDAPYQHLAAEAALRDFDSLPTSPQTFQYYSTPTTEVYDGMQPRERLHSTSSIASRPPILSSTGRASTSGTMSTSSTVRSSTHIRSIPITFKAGTSSLRALARNGREPKVERFNYAKALLRSDDELEKLAEKIRTEINESELFELALAAEKAAEAGEVKFTGRASTFGIGEQHSTPIISSAAPNVATPTFGPSKTPATPPQSKPVRTTSSAAMRRAPSISAPITPTATPSPRIPLRMDVGLSASKRFPTAGPGGSAIRPSTVGERSISEPQLSTLSLLDSAIVVTPSHKPQQPEKRSMRIHSLRDVSEVIPHFKELHSHMRTHLYRERVEVKSLFFKEWQPSHPVDSNLGWGRFRNGMSTPRTNSAAAVDGNGNRSDHVPKHVNSTRQHRRSRSFFDDIAEMRLPGFGHRKSMHEGICTSRSFDNNFSDDTTQGSTPGVSHQKLFEKTLSSRISPAKMGDDAEQLRLLRKVAGTAHPDEKACDSMNANTEDRVLAASTEVGEDNSRCLFSFENEGSQTALSTARLPRRPAPFDLEELHLSITAENAQSLHNRSSCSSETSSVGSTDDVDVDDRREDVLHRGIRTDCISPGADVHGSRSPVSSPKLTTSKKIVLSPLPNESGVHSVSLLDDGSTCPTSPLHESSLETFIYQSYPPLEEVAPAKAPLTPKAKTPAESEFNTPAHLRVIKRLHRNSSTDAKETHVELDQQQEHKQLQPRLEPLRQGQKDETFISTPAMKVGTPLEPNSIVAHSDGAPNGNHNHERATVPSMYESETQFLALPTIHSVASDLTLEQVSQKFVRRTLRPHWPVGGSHSSLASPTTPAVSSPIAFMPPMKKSENFLLQPTLASHEERKFESEENLDEDQGYHTCNMDKNPRHVGDLLGHTEARSHAEQILDMPVQLVHRSEVGADTTSAALTEGKTSLHDTISDILNCPVEEKKECDNEALTLSQEHHILATESEKSTLRSLSKPLPGPPLLHEEAGCSRYPPQVDLDSSILSKFEEKVQENEHEDNSEPRSKELTTPLPAASDSRTVSPSLQPETETWDGQLVADLDVPTVNSILTGSNGNDAAVILAEMSSDSQDFITRSYASCSTVGRHLVGSHGHQSLCHSLPSTDENFKAALQGVLSHLTLSPRSDQLHAGVFIPDAENKEFLTNYFYCTKKEALPERGDGPRDTRFVDGEGGGLSCAEPCSGGDTQCYLYGVDAVCSGFAYLFPTTTTTTTTTAASGRFSGGSSGSVSVSGGSVRRTGSDGLYSASRDRTGKEQHPLMQQPQSHHQPHADIDWQHQHQQQNNSEGWMGMFQKAATQRFKFQFQSDNELERSRHSFNPPCLSRRVIPPPNRSHERTTSLHHEDNDAIGNLQLQIEGADSAV
jgi:hypothetical protein